MELRCTFDPPEVNESERRIRRAESLLACYQQFLGHDLPNRFVAAQGLARLLLDDVGPGLDADLRSMLERLADLILQADVETRRLAGIGRLERDIGPPTATPLAEVVREAIDETLLLAGRPIQVDVADGLPTVLASRRAVRAALVELLRNAVAATPADRPVRVQVTATVEEERIALHVHDEVTGISAEMMQRLDRLLNAGDLDALDGRGLFVVGQLVAGWDGGLNLRSEPGRGTTVTLLFRPAP
jgi:signal transduction histidine kinase